MSKELVIKTPDTPTNTSKALVDFLRNYTPTIIEVERDTLERRYKIDLNSPLPDFDTKTARAYLASDNKKPNQQLVAIICAVGMLPRHNTINPLKNSPHPNIMPIIASGVVELSRPQEERFVIIYERPKGKKLSELIATAKTRPSFEFISQNIISPLALAVQHLSELGIVHGNINCENIYFDKTAIVGHFSAESCGFSQIFYYESVERMQSLPAGKGDGDSMYDFYAIAIVTLHLIYGANHFSGITEDALIKEILKNGAFNAVTRQKDMPEIFYDFFRGLLSQNSRERWGYKYLKAWLDGKRYNVMPPPPQQESIRPFEFGNSLANTRKEVAHLFFKNWKDVAEVFLDGSLANWVAISLRNKELNEFVISTTKSLNTSKIGTKNNINYDEQIVQAISFFDHTGPVRFRKLAFHIDGINSLFANLMLSDSKEEMQLLLQFIELSMFNFIMEQKSKEAEKREDIITRPIELTLSRLDRLRSIIRNKGWGFGMERVFYELNPSIQCMSPIVAGSYITTLTALLKTLDRKASSTPNDRLLFDPHIAAFISSNLNIQHNINLSNLDDYPELANNEALIALKLFSRVQNREKISYLPGLTHLLAIQILPSLEVLNSNTLKRKLEAMLIKTAQSGDTQKMVDIFVESGYAKADNQAFNQALNKFKQNANNIKYFNSKEVIEENSRKLGTNMAHYVAMVALVLSFIFSVWGS